MRLGDLDALKESWTIASPEPHSTSATEVVNSIEQAPTIDAVPVVRCLNCKYKGVLWRETICDHPNGMLHKVKPDDFCSYGQRKESELD